ncbi:hypothetical protein BP5796_09931 [Coleophoma crateriformis]|uniref:EthD domain-containing protein n=1 Tax=Coleophoma crateriformis TaxID=565419 RepID=A0A3D8QTW9_9HELO|nr:hypothetical protein BP5796_09931 [Coleophoma crateriformis]
MENPAAAIHRITVFFKRKPGLTEEEFSQHWEKFHTPSHLRARPGDVPSGEGALDYDGGADFYVADYASYEAAFRDPYYINVIEPDERRFVDKGSQSGAVGTRIVGAVSTVGFEKVIIEGGKAMVGHGGLKL